MHNLSSAASSKFKKFLTEYSYLLMIPIAAIVLIGNYNGKNMQGMLEDYLDFKRIILAGFNPAAAIYHSPAFPMWGYGWLLILTQSKLVFFLAQISAGIYLSCYAVRWLKTSLDIDTAAVVSGLLILSIPWYAYFSLWSPYPISTILLSFSIFILSRALTEERNTKQLLFSGLLLGLSLNFRSDHILLPFFLGGFIAIIFPSKKMIRQIIIWALPVYLCLIPWMLYSKRATGHYLVTSTNGGTTSFLGLGQLPGNKWGITCVDGDPLAAKILAEKLGEKNVYAITTYEANMILKKEFMLRVKADPFEYLKKVGYCLFRTLIDGVYPGEFYERKSCLADCEKNYHINRIVFLKNPIGFTFHSPWDGFLLSVQLGSGLWGRLTVFVSIMMLSFNLIGSIKAKLIFPLINCLVIIYQIIMGIMICHKSSSTAIVYLQHLINIGVFFYFLRKRNAARAGH